MWNSILIAYLTVVNILALCLMWIDKRKARKNRWRIKEKTLFTVALLGGAIGILAGMRLFRHKTKHLTFTIGVPVVLVLNIIVVYWCMIS